MKARLDQRLVRTNRKAWSEALRRGLIVGSAASVASTLAIAGRSAVEARSAISATNAISHWLWGDRAKRQHRASARYTLPGYLIHHASSVLWGVVYERFFADRTRSATTNVQIANAAAVATIAAVTDYLLTPKRFTPGFEAHLSVRSMVLVYATFAAGLFGARYLLNRTEVKDARRVLPWRKSTR